jgi:hypothetical protein
MSEKSVAQKLLIKANSRLLFVNAPQGYLQAIGSLPQDVSLVEADSNHKADFIQVFVKDRHELEKALQELLPRLAGSGALWITYYKGTSQLKTDINRDSIWKIAQPYDLRPIRQIAIDDDWSALGFKLNV